MRFIAAVIVVLYHQKSFSDFLGKAPQTITAGPQMVTFFFVLSGFTLFFSYWNKDKFSSREYIKKRAVRVLPIYLLALFLSAFFIVMRGDIDTTAFFLNLFLIQSWIPPCSMSINGPGWFLSTLIFFYILFPFILKCTKQYRVSPKSFFFFSLLLWTSTQTVAIKLLNSQLYHKYPSVIHDLILYFPISHLCSFMLGIAGALLLTNRSLPNLKRVTSALLTILSLILIIITIENQSSLNNLFGLQLPFGSSLYAPLFLFLIINVHSLSESKKVNSLTNFINTLGQISFSIYIMQIPTFGFTNYFLKYLAFSSDTKLLIYLSTLLFVSTTTLIVMENPIRKLLTVNASVKIVQQSQSP